MSASDVYNALRGAISGGSISLWSAANGSPALAGLVPVLELFGISADNEETLNGVNLSQGTGSVRLTGSGTYGQIGAPAAHRSTVNGTLTYTDSGDSFSLNLQVTGTPWIFSVFFLNLPKTMRADVSPESSGGVRWFDTSCLDGVAVNSAAFTARSSDTTLSMSGFLPEFADPDISDRLALLSPWPLRLSGTLTMPAKETDFPLLDLSAQGSSANMFSAANDGGVKGPQPINVTGLFLWIISEKLDPETWGEPAFTTLKIAGNFDLGGNLNGTISNLVLSNGSTWSYSVLFDKQNSLTQGLTSLGKIFGVDLPVPMNFPLLNDFYFAGVDIDFANSGTNKHPSLSISGLAVTVRSDKTWTPPVPFVEFTNVGTRWVWGWTIVNDPVTGGNKNIYLLTGSVFASVVFPKGDGEEGTLAPLLPQAPPGGPEGGGGESLPAPGGDAVTIDVSLSIPSFYINGNMRLGAYIGIGAAFNKYFPSGVCPIVPENMNVTRLGFFADPYGQVYSGSMTILFGTPDNPDRDQGWKIIEINTLSITLESLEMWVQADGGKVGGGISGIFYLDGLSSEQLSGGKSLTDLQSAPRIAVSAEYPPGNSDTNAGWNFAGSLYPGTSIDLTKMVARFIEGEGDPHQVPDYVPRLSVDLLNATFQTASGAYTFQGAMSARWNPTIFGTDLKISASASVDIARENSGATPQGKMWGTFSVNKLSVLAGMDIGVAEPTYMFKVQFDDLWAQGVTSWRGTTANRHQVISFQLGGVTLGRILEFLVNLAAPTIGYRLDPPWDLLNRIDLSRFVLTIDPKENVVEFVFNASVDIGVMRIDSVGARYTKKNGEGTVNMILTGNFLGENYGAEDPLMWDLVNDSPPAVSGQNSTLVDLHFIGVGQRITFSGPAPDTVAESVEALRGAMAPPAPDSNPLANPKIVFSDKSQWLIGLKVTLMKMIDLGIIFNDPKLYGLSIALTGEKAGSLAGLRFEILYKKITDNIGMYRIELRVPDAFRTIQLGAVSLTLGIVVVEIYTNGNFMIDLGFPYNRVYTRSFTIQAGIFIGRGGFYFGALNGDTSTRVPKITNGNFAPVIELGIGIAAGVGREVRAGILAGGAYIEIEVLFQGVLAWFNPTSSGSSPAKYYWAQGTVAIHGKVYGSVDFVVVSVSVTLEVWAQASAIFESCMPILLDFSAGVSAEASIKILFIRIHFHFSVTLEFSFTIGSQSPTPWILQAGGATGQSASVRGIHAATATQNHYLRHTLLKETHRSLERHLRSLQLAAAESGTNPYLLVWNPDKLVFGMKKTAQLAMLPLFSLKDIPVDWTGGAPANPSPAYRGAFLLYADTGIDANAKTASECLARSSALSGTAKEDADTSGLAADLLTRGMLLYSLFTLPNGPQSTGDAISAGQLLLIAEQMDRPETKDAGFSYDNLVKFFTANLDFIVYGVPSGGTPETKSAMIFPIPPCFSWDSPQWGQTDFSTFNTVGEAYEQQVAKILGAYFPVGKENQGTVSTEESFSKFIFRDYFEMVAKAAVNEAQNQLKNQTVTFDYEAASPLVTLSDAANSFAFAQMPVAKIAGDTVASVAERIGATEEEIEYLNPDPARTIADAPVGSMMHFNIGVTPATIALDNAEVDFVTASLPLGVVPIPASGKNNTFDSFQMLGRVTVEKILSYLPDSQETAGQNPNLLSEGSAFDLGASRIFTPAADSGFDLDRSAALFFVRYDDPDLDAAVEVSYPDWYAQTIVLWNDLAGAFSPTGGANPMTVELKPGTHLKVPSKFNTYTPTAANYTTVAGDTLYRIGSTLALVQDGLNPPRWSAFKSQVTQTGNSFVIPPWKVDAATGNKGIVVQHGENVETLARRLVIDAAFTGDPVKGTWQYTYDWAAISTWIAAAPIIAPQGIVIVPEATTDIEVTLNFKKLAETYGLTIADAANRLKDYSVDAAGGKKTGLYADKTPLTVKQVPVRTVQQVLDGVLSGASYIGVVNQSSRMMMAGLTLPSPVSQSGMMVADPAKHAPMYDLSGQQQDIIIGAKPGDAALSLTVSSSESWIGFGNAFTVREDDTLDGLLGQHDKLLFHNPGLTAPEVLKPGMVLISGAPPSCVLTFGFTNGDVTRGLATGLSIKTSPATPPAPQAMPLKGTRPSTYGFQQKILLQSPVPLKIPGETPVSGTPTLWPFPASFLARSEGEKYRNTPYEIFANLAGTSQNADPSPVASTTWGMNLPFTIRKIDEGTQRFALIGVDTGQRHLLLQLREWLASDPDASKTQKLLCIPPAPNASNAQGYVLLDPAQGSTYLIKTNLSTESLPPPTLALPMGGAANGDVYTADFVAALEDFVLLLWEGSTVGGTGYCFGCGTPLPGSVFDERGIGTLNLLVIAGSQQDSPSTDGRTLLPFNNCLLVASGLDASINTLYAEAGDNSDVTEISHTPAGNAGFTLLLDRRLADPSITEDQRNTEDRFNLIAYGTASAPYVIPEALAPTLPTPDDGSGKQLWEKRKALRKAGKSPRALADTESPYWRYDQVIPFYNFTVAKPQDPTAGLPDPAQDPYRGFGDLAQYPTPELTFRFADLMGNKTATPPPGEGTLGLPVGYTDPLIGTCDWPSLSSFFLVGGTPGSAQLTATLALKGAAQLPSPTQRIDSNADAISKQREKYAQIHYQTIQNGVEATLSTTLEWQPDASGKNMGQKVSVDPVWRLAAGAYAFTSATELLVSVTPGNGTIDKLLTDWNVRFAETAEANKGMPVSGLVGGTSPLSIPACLPAMAQKSLDNLYASRPAGWPDAGSGSALFSLPENADLPMNAGTVMKLPAMRTVSTGTTTPTPAIADLAAAAFVTPEILATDNRSATGVLATGLVFEIAWEESDGTLLTATVTVADASPYQNTPAPNTFDGVAANFAVQGFNLKIGDIVAQNAGKTGMFNANQTLNYTSYVIQPGDTPSVNKSGCTSADLGSVNETTPGIFNDGTLVSFGNLSVSAGPETLEDISVRYGISPQGILEANATRPAGNNLAIPGCAGWPTDAATLAQIRIPYTVQEHDLLATVAARFAPYDGSSTGNATASDAVKQNRYLKKALAPNTTIGVSVEGTAHHVTTGPEGDSFQSFLERVQAVAPHATLDDVADATATLSGALETGALLLFNRAVLTSAASPDDIFTAYGIDAASFALANLSATKLIAQGVTLICKTDSKNACTLITRTNETFNSLVVAFALQTLTIDAGEIARQNNTVQLYVSGALALLPPAPAAPSISLGTGGPYEKPVFPIAATLTLTRPEALVNPQFDKNGPVQQAAAPIAPFSEKPEGSDVVDPGLTYNRFIGNLTAAIPTLRAGTAKVDGVTSDLWGVDFSSTGISNVALSAGTIWEGNKLPRFFALAPLYNELVTRNGVPIKTLDDHGNLTTGNPVNFQAVDVEPMAQRFLADFDRFLSLDYASALYTYNNGEIKGTLSSTIEEKQQLIPEIAAGLKTVLDLYQGLFADQGTGKARASFAQQLGVSLSKGYETSVAIQYDLSVTSPWTTGSASTPPASLYGEASIITATGEPASATSIVSAKTSLDAASGAVTFFATLSDPAHTRALRGTLEYTYSYTEFGITQTDVPDGYTKSDWLAQYPLLDVTTKPDALTGTNPGEVAAPIPLRSFPALPSIKEQTATASVKNPGGDLSQLSLWSYGFTYAHQHAEQDTVFIEVEFNLKPATQMMLKADDRKDLFTELAQYSAVADKLWKQLDPFVGPNPAPDANSANAANTFFLLAQAIRQYWTARHRSDQPDPGKKDPYVAENPPYRFSARVDYGKKDGITAVTSYSLTRLDQTPGPSGHWPDIFAISPDGEEIALVPGTETGVEVVVYKVPTAKTVPASNALAFKLVWRDINVSAFQNARSRVKVSRNLFLLEGPESKVPTNPDFVLNSAEILANGIVTPLLQWSDRTKITGTSLEDALSTALDALFPAAGTLPGTKATYGVYYAYELSPNALIGKTPVKTYPDQSPGASAATAIQGVLTEWQRIHAPSTTGGEWSIGIILYSALEASQRPLFAGELYYQLT